MQGAGWADVFYTVLLSECCVLAWGPAACVSRGVARAGAPGTVCCVLVSASREALAKACSLCQFFFSPHSWSFLLFVLKKINSATELPVCSNSGDLLLPEVRFQWEIWSGPWYDFSLPINVD